MSDSKKFHFARKCTFERSESSEQYNDFRKNNNDTKQGLKHPLQCIPKKNFANDRLNRLVASLQAEVQKSNNRPNKSTPNDTKQGLKHPLQCIPKNNFANDRLKRLISSLQAEAQKSNNNRPNKSVPKKFVSTVSNGRKRSSAMESSSGLFQNKVSRNNELGVSVLLKSPVKSLDEDICSGDTSDIFTIQQYSCAENAKRVSSDIEAMEWEPADVNMS